MSALPPSPAIDPLRIVGVRNLVVPKLAAIEP